MVPSSSRTVPLLSYQYVRKSWGDPSYSCSYIAQAEISHVPAGGSEDVRSMLSWYEAVPCPNFTAKLFQVGSNVGSGVGSSVGSRVGAGVGAGVGALEGMAVGINVGLDDGVGVVGTGVTVGFEVGRGEIEGAGVGALDGRGEAVGALVGGGFFFFLLPPSATNRSDRNMPRAKALMRIVP